MAPTAFPMCLRLPGGYVSSSILGQNKMLAYLVEGGLFILG